MAERTEIAPLPRYVDPDPIATEWKEVELCRHDNYDHLAAAEFRREVDARQKLKKVMQG